MTDQSDKVADRTPPFAVPNPDDKSKSSRRATPGIINPGSVRIVSFIIVAVALFATAGMCILAVWDYAPKDVAWRSLSTLGIVSVALVAFMAINEKFGS